MLHFTKPVDEYITNKLREFGRKKFTSISRERIKFNDKDEDMVKRKDRSYTKKYNPPTKWLKNLYGGDVRKLDIIPINHFFPVP